MKKKIFLAIVVFILMCISFIGGSFYEVLKQLDKTWEPSNKYYSIFFMGEVKTTLYVKTCVWGLLGQHHNIIISTKDVTSKSWNFDLLRDYEFFSDEIFYKFQEPDSLVIYSNQIVDKPLYFNSHIKIIQKELNLKKGSDNIKKNFEKEGLSKITTY